MPVDGRLKIIKRRPWACLARERAVSRATQGNVYAKTAMRRRFVEGSKCAWPAFGPAFQEDKKVFNFGELRRLEIWTSGLRESHNPNPNPVA